VPTGTLTFTDVDLSDTHTLAVSLQSAIWSADDTLSDGSDANALVVAHLQPGVLLIGQRAGSDGAKRSSGSSPKPVEDGRKRPYGRVHPREGDEPRRDRPAGEAEDRAPLRSRCAT
jgi:hypothetical protein